MKRIVLTTIAGLILGVSAFAQNGEPDSNAHFHAHVLSHAAKYSYKAAKEVTKGGVKVATFAAKQLI
jgi:hypothetical protein